MTDMRLCSWFAIVLLLWYSPVLGDFPTEKIKEVTDFNLNLLKFDGLSDLIVDHEAYAEVLKNVDQMYSNHVFKTPNENRTRYSVEVIKRYKFIDRFLCSHALSALAYAKIVKQIFEFMDSNAKLHKGEIMIVKTQDISLFDFTVAFLGNVSRTLAVLYGLNVALPKWTIVAGMIANEVRNNSSSDKLIINPAVFSHLRRLIDFLVENISQFKKWCAAYLGGTYVADVSEDYDIVINVLNARANKMDKAHASEVLEYEYPIELFEFQLCKFMYELAKNENLDLFIGNTPSASPLGINWSDLFINLTLKLNTITVPHKNGMLKLYEDDLGSKSSIPFVLKNVFRTVIVRHVLITVTYCENMDRCVKKDSLYYTRPNSNYKTLCDPIMGAVTMAAVLLDGDKFLMDLIVLLKTETKDEIIPEVSKIVIKSLEFLNVMSAILGVDVVDQVEPPDCVYVIDSDWMKLFPKVTEAVNAMLQYINNINNTFPLLNFKILDAIQNPI